MSDWTMDFEPGYVPMFGRRLEPGKYLMEIATVEADSQQGKGDFVRFTYKVQEGPDKGATMSERLMILNSNFRPSSDKHASAVKDNWYNLLVACGVQPTTGMNMRDVSETLVGTILGVEVVHAPGKGKNKGKTYANIQSYMPASAMTTVAADVTSAASSVSDDDSDSTPDLMDLG